MNDKMGPLPEVALLLSKDTEAAILRRLRRLEGQARGVQRMVEEGRDCREILHQIAAIKAAAHSLGAVVLEHYVMACLEQPLDLLSQEEMREVVREAIRQMSH